MDSGENPKWRNLRILKKNTSKIIGSEKDRKNKEHEELARYSARTRELCNPMTIHLFQRLQLKRLSEGGGAASGCVGVD